jgi:hypothetical protein
MRILNRALSVLFLAAVAATASAQTAAPNPVWELLDHELSLAIKSHSNNVTGEMIALALADAQAQAGASEADAEFRAVINRRRTDVQLGATSNSPNATSVMEKPGIADLLSLALDRGAITKSPSGTGLTLSTTPYAFWTGFGMADTPQRWNKARLARNLSFSATFSSTDVTAGDFSSFTSGEVKWVITGNRSPRDPALLDGVRAKLGAIFLAKDHSTDLACHGLFILPDVTTAEGNMNTWLRGNPDAPLDQARAQFQKELEPVAKSVTPEMLNPCIAVIMEGDKSTAAGLDFVTEATKAYLAAQRPQFSIATLFVRDETLSDYYVAKALFGKDYQQVTLNANAEASWNKESTTPEGVPLHRLRAYSGELGLNTKTFANGRIDGSVSAKGSSDEATDAKFLVIGEAKLNLHLNDTMRLPVTLSYANRETQTIKQGWQVNVGISALLDDVMRRLK